jgi:sec-independent protein translocase protein TatA
MLPHMGPMELLVIFGIALLIFGPKALPSLGKSIGGGIRNLKRSMNARDDEADAEEAAERAAAAAKAAPVLASGKEAVKDLGPRA